MELGLPPIAHLEANSNLPWEANLPPSTFSLRCLLVRIFKRLLISFYKSKRFCWMCTALHDLAGPIFLMSSPTRLPVLPHSPTVTASDQSSNSSQLLLLPLFSTASTVSSVNSNPTHRQGRILIPSAVGVPFLCPKAAMATT